MHNLFLILILTNHLISKFIFNYQVNKLIEEYKNEVLLDLESILNPNVCIITEKESNFGIFEKLIKDKSKDKSKNKSKDKSKNKSKNEYFIMKINGKLTLIDGIMKNDGILFASFSPYLTNDQMYFYSTEGRFKNKIKETVLKLYDLFKRSEITEYKKGIIKYEREYQRRMILHRFNLEGCEEIIESEIENEIEGDNRNEILSYLNQIDLKGIDSNTIERITLKLIEMLLNLKILKSKIDIEEFPEIIPILFPYKMMKTGEIIKIGVDFSKIKGSIFEEYFDLEEVKRYGMKYYRTVIKPQ